MMVRSGIEGDQGYCSSEGLYGLLIVFWKDTGFTPTWGKEIPGAESEVCQVALSWQGWSEVRASGETRCDNFQMMLCNCIFRADIHSHDLLFSGRTGGPVALWLNRTALKFCNEWKDCVSETWSLLSAIPLEKKHISEMDFRLVHSNSNQSHLIICLGHRVSVILW